MADRTITARLRTTYDKTGTDAAAKGLRQYGDQAKKTSQNVGRDWSSIGKSVSGLGDSLTTKVSLPLIGLGALATKAAADFDAAFVQMQTLAGVSADEVDGLKESVLELAGETGKAPQELADAMFFLQSSGLDAAGAMDALTVSAKASAAGLGDTVTLADAASSVMMAYAESGMTAAQALDTLVATARAGKAEPAAIAGQLSKIIPVASALNISFEDVGGALAALSTKGFSAEQAATGLAGIMAKLMRPSQQAQEALDAVGLSGNRLEEILGERGLPQTLLFLKERLGDNGFETFIEDQEAIRAATALTTGDIEGMSDIFEEVADSAGSTEKAFETWAESMGAKNARAFAEFQVALIRLGEVIAPIASDVMAFVAEVVGGFGKLPGPVQKLVLAFAAVAAAVGPLMSAGGRLVSVWSAAMKAWENFSRSGGQAFADAMNAGTESTNNLGRGMGKLKAVLVGGGIAGAIIGIKSAADAMRDARNAAAIDDLAESFVAMGDDIDDAFEKIVSDLDEFGQLDKLFNQLLESNPEAAKRLIEVAEAAGVSADKIDEMRGSLERKRDADAQAAIDSEANQEAIEGTTEAMADQEQAVNEAAEAFKNYAAEVQATFDPVFGMVHAMRQNDEAQRAVQESLAAVNEAREEHGRNSAEAREAEIAYHDALLATGEAAEGVQVAAATLNAAIAENPALLDSATASLEQWVAQGLITEDQAKFLADQFGVTALQATALGETDPTVDVSETGSRRTRDQLTQVENGARRIPERRNTRVSTSGTGPAARSLGDVIALVHALPRSRTITVNAVLNDTTGGKLAALAGRRARGGPVKSNRLYEVAENAKHEMFESQGHRYLLPGADGTVIPIGPMTSGASFAGGGGDTFVFNVGVVGSQREFDRMVQRAFNTRLRKGRGLNAA